MPAALRLDTLKFAKRLTEAGLPPAAAEAIVEGLNDSDLSELATKAELQTSIAEVRAEIAALRSELKSEIATLRADLYGRLWAMGLGIVGLTVALIKLLPG
jgi:DNA-binding transcriptional MerR regulator